MHSLPSFVDQCVKERVAQCARNLVSIAESVNVEDGVANTIVARASALHALVSCSWHS